MRRRILVVIPTFNEAENLPRIIPLVLAQDPAIDLLVVDDRSPDGTGEIAEALAAGSAYRRPGAGKGEAEEKGEGEGSPRLHVLHRREKDGLGRAYLAGFEWGMERGYPIFLQMDADLSHPPEAIPALLAVLEPPEAADFAIGSRYVGGRVNVVNWPLTRLIISLFGSAYARAVTGLETRDCTGGFNCFRREVLEAVHLDRIRSNGYSFQIELKFRAWRKGFRLIEVPIVFTERDTGESKMSGRIVREAVWRVWSLRLRDLLGML